MKSKPVGDTAATTRESSNSGRLAQAVFCDLLSCGERFDFTGIASGDCELGVRLVKERRCGGRTSASSPGIQLPRESESSTAVNAPGCSQRIRESSILPEISHGELTSYAFVKADESRNIDVGSCANHGDPALRCEGALMPASPAAMISRQGALAGARLFHNQQVIPKHRVLVLLA